MTADESVLTSLDDGVLTVTLNRPRRKNAIDGATWEVLRRTFYDAGHSREVRVLVLTGAGGDFCAGADLAVERGEDHAWRRMQIINETALVLHELPVPTVAKVSGVAVGAGWNLALGCDLVVAATDARFSQIFAKRGLSLDFGGSWLLPKIVGLQRAKRLALLAEIIDAAEAERLGLVTYLVEPAELDGFVADLGTRLAAGPPVAMALSKTLLNENADRTFRDALASEARSQAVNFAGTDVPSAFRAFLEKTEPKFTGQWAVK
jgi:enoyl-CoA hydratase/carnithine racemase